MNPISRYKLLFAALAVFVFSQCTEEELTPAAENAIVPAEPAGSVTISGVYTVYEDVKDCRTCTFLVPPDQAVVDGHKLNLKPGSVICLDKAIQYGDISFINLEGTEQHPIRIGTCGTH